MSEKPRFYFERAKDIGPPLRAFYVRENETRRVKATRLLDELGAVLKGAE